MTLIKIKMLVEDEHRKKGSFIDMPLDTAKKLIAEGKAKQATEEENKKAYWKEKFDPDKLPNPHTPTFIDLNSAMKKGVPPMNWIVKNIVPERGITIIGAPPKNYKTFIAMELALSITLNELYFDHFSTQQVKVLYVDEENGYATLIRRFEQLGLGKGIKEYPDNLFISSMEGIKLDDRIEQGRDKLDLLIQETGAQVVILDSLVRFMIGEEDKATNVRKVFESLKYLMEEHNTSFVILHHFRKGHKPGDNAMDSLRGSGDFAAFAGVILSTWSPRKGKGLEVDYIANRHIDMNDLNDFIVAVETEGSSINFKYICDKEVSDNKKDNAIEILEEWFDNDSVESFTSAMCIDYLKTQGIAKRDYMYNALDILQQEGKVSKIGRGKWRVLKSLGQVGDKQNEL